MTKSAEAFRTISEVAEALQTPAHVLRFWESKFTQIRPIKRAGGRRYYRPEDVALIAGIRKLLHEDGLTIRGVQKIIKERGVRHVAALGAALPLPESAAPAVTGVPLPGGMTMPDDAAMPDDMAVPEADEAPMMVDAPTLPFGDGMPIRPAAFAAEPVPPAPARAAEPEPPAPAPAAPEPLPAGDSFGAGYPAASLLRAMDAARAATRRDEIAGVYRRLQALRDRVAGA